MRPWEGDFPRFQLKDPKSQHKEQRHLEIENSLVNPPEYEKVLQGQSVLGQNRETFYASGSPCGNPGPTA